MFRSNSLHRIPRTVKLGIMVAAFGFLAWPAPTLAHEHVSGPAGARVEPMHIVSSVQLTQDTVAKATRAGRDAYAHILAPYAKITPAAAEKAALTRFPGAQCKNVSLHSLRQNLVYLAVLEKGDMRYLAIIDAGNGTTLATREMALHRHILRRDMW
ncbi:MAG: hypothetical protein ACYCVB_04770 [Bacilli bacterium]